MKKLIILVFLITSTTYSLDLNLGLNYNKGNIKLNNNFVDYEGEAYGLQLEFRQSLLNFDLGLGLSYEKSYELKGTGEKFDAIPIFASTRVYLFPIAVKPYIVVKGGIIKFSGEENISFTSDGEYYSIGLGLKLLGKLDLEGLYSYRVLEISNEEIESNIYTLSISYEIF